MQGIEAKEGNLGSNNRLLSVVNAFMWAFNWTRSNKAGAHTAPPAEFNLIFEHHGPQRENIVLARCSGTQSAACPTFRLPNLDVDPLSFPV